MLANFARAEFVKTVSNFRKKKESHCLVFTFSRTKRELRHFHVVVVQWRQRNGQKSVMHGQSCYFANLNLSLFCRSRCCRCCLRWCFTGRFATTIFSATERCNIVVTLFGIVTTLFQHCNALLRSKSSLRIVLCNIAFKPPNNIAVPLYDGMQYDRLHVLGEERGSKGWSQAW